MPPSEPGKRPSSAAEEWNAIRTLAPYLWPAAKPVLKARVVVALLCLAAAKGTNVVVPIFYKQAVDSLTSAQNAHAAVVVPLALLLAYGLARVMAQAFGELRDAVFTSVTQRAMRVAGLKTFEHLHQLSLRFHLERKTGAVSRAIERGTAGIEFLLRFMLFNIMPTILEVGLVCGILWYLYGPSFAILTAATLLIYIVWTLRVMNGVSSTAGP